MNEKRNIARRVKERYFDGEGENDLFRCRQKLYVFVWRTQNALSAGMADKLLKLYEHRSIGIIILFFLLFFFSLIIF